MEGEPSPASKTASREASEWFVYLQDDPDDATLRRRFGEWLAASPQHAAAWSETLRTSSLAESLLPFDARDWNAAAGSAPAPAEPSRGIAATPHRWRLPLVAAALAAILVFLGAPSAILRLQSDYTTSTAQVRDIELQDGSVVTLAPDSAIAVSYTAAERHVRLLAGEAFFSVKSNAARPFHVVARDVRTSVLGTSFDVRLEKHGVGVAVLEGRVRIESSGIAEVLSAGQSLRLASDGGTAQRSDLPVQTIGTWRQGRLVIEEAPLRSAVERLERYFGGTIVLTDSALADRPVTGIFDLGQPEAALRAMAKALGAKVRKITPWILVVSND